MKRENGYSWNDSEESLGRSNMNHVSGLVISSRVTATAMHVMYLESAHYACMILAHWELGEAMWGTNILSHSPTL
jgi:hypothetical protein